MDRVSLRDGFSMFALRIEVSELAGRAGGRRLAMRQPATSRRRDWLT